MNFQRLYKLYKLGTPTCLDKLFTDIREYFTGRESLIIKLNNVEYNCSFNEDGDILYFFIDRMFITSFYMKILTENGIILEDNGGGLGLSDFNIPHYILEMTFMITKDLGIIGDNYIVKSLINESCSMMYAIKRAKI